MQQPFTQPIDANYLANQTLSKKIRYLEDQLDQSQKHNVTLKKSILTSQKTIDRLLINRTNHQILVSMQHTIQQYQSSIASMDKQIKLLNSKLLIQQQLRHQERIDSLLKIRELQFQNDELKIKMRDKDHQYIVVLGRLRKYQDLKQLTVRSKLEAFDKKIIITDKDKEQIIKNLTQQLTKYKTKYEYAQVDIDRKLAVLAYGIRKGGYDQMVEEFRQLKALNQQVQIPKQFKQPPNQNKAVVNNKASFINPSYIWSSIKGLKQSGKPKDNVIEKISKSSSSTIDAATKELIKQLKKSLLGYKLLQSALNKSIQRNQQLLTYNQILMDSNQMLEQRLHTYKKIEPNIKMVVRTQQIIRQFENNNGQLKRQLNNKSAYSRNKHIQHMDSMAIKQSFYEENSLDRFQKKYDQKRLQTYLTQLRSDNYQVNIKQLARDVRKMSQFLILSVWKQTKNKKTSRLSISLDRGPQLATKKQNQIKSIKKTNKNILTINQQQNKYRQKERERNDDFEIVQY